MLLVVLFAWLISISAGTAPSPFLRGNRLLVPLLLFVGMNVVSLTWSYDQIATLKFALQITEIVVIFPVVFASLPTSLITIKQGLVVYLIGTCILAVYYLASGTQDISGGLNKNVVGSYAAAGFIVAFTFMVSERPTAARALCASAVLLQGAVLVVAYSRGSIIGALVAALLVSFVLKRARVMTAGLVAVAVGLAAVYGFDSRTDLSQAGAYTSTSVRVSTFAHAVDYIRAAPFLGSGAGTYSDYVPEIGSSLPDPNNTFLLTWAEVGVFGIVALLFLYSRFSQVLILALRCGREAGTLAVACGGVSVAFLVHFQFDVTWTRGTSTTAFIMMGLMIAALRQGALTTSHQPERGPYDSSGASAEPATRVLTGV